MSPSAMMLKYATNYSQPFLAVLAACYQVSIKCIYNIMNKSLRMAATVSERDLRHYGLFPFRACAKRFAYSVACKLNFLTQ